MGVKEHTIGEVRYITYYLYFPDGDIWVDQQPFCGDIQFTLINSQFRKNKDILRDLLHKGMTHWKDKNKVTHHVVIEDKEQPRKWGIRKNA